MERLGRLEIERAENWGDWEIWRLELEEMGRIGKTRIGKLGEWKIGRLGFGDWEIERLEIGRNWETERLEKFGVRRSRFEIEEWELGDSEIGNGDFEIGRLEMEKIEIWEMEAPIGILFSISSIPPFLILYLFLHSPSFSPIPLFLFISYLIKKGLKRSFLNL